MTLIRYTFDKSVDNSNKHLSIAIHVQVTLNGSNFERSKFLISQREIIVQFFFLFITKKIFTFDLSKKGTLVASSWVKLMKLKGNDSQIISKYSLNMDFWKPSQCFPNYTCTCIFDMWLLRMCCLPVYVLTLSYCHFLCWNVLNKELRTLILLHWKKYKQRFAYILHLHVIN